MVKIILKLQKYILFIATFSVLSLGVATSANALVYVPCNEKNSPLSCNIALEKLRTLKNPLKNHNYFDNGLHYVDGELFLYPDIYVAEADLDNDGFKEIIILLPEEDELMVGHYCKAVEQCAHYILQDRNTGNKPNLKNIKAMGPIYTYAIGLSTDEVVDGYRSLKTYTDKSWKNFNVHQYDRKSDDYFNVSVPE